MKISASRRISSLLQKGNLNWHNRILSLGIGTALVYATTRLIDVSIDSFGGSSGGLLIAAAGFGFFRLWVQQDQLKQIQASEEDRLLGYILILSGAAIYPFCLFAIWAQAIDCLVILAGLACSHWGLSFFGRHPFPPVLIAVGLLPKTTLVIEAAYQALLPPDMLENWMAWSGSVGLQMIGQQAAAAGRIIVMPAGSVTVAYGCNGLYMAITMMAASFVLGLFLKQDARVIAWMVLIGAALALVTNIPRIMLMAIAAVYWSEQWFHFWHDSWGGQIFVGGLFTIYYYAVMALVNERSKPSNHRKPSNR